MRIAPIRLVACLFVWLAGSAVVADPPAGFESRVVLSGLQDPVTLEFSPDGRMFVAERIAGRLRVARRDWQTGEWALVERPFATFDVPVDAAGIPERHRSSGLRDCTFDPEFRQNGFLYCFYMRDSPRHNRIVRLQADPPAGDVAAATPTVLLELPFNEADSSGSHNGGAMAFGPDDRLYVTTGDGWNGGDAVQRLDTWTGKLLRIERDGAIPADNAFVATAQGPFRAIHALGLRNPYSIGRDPADGSLWINDVSGSDKARIYPVATGANYGHQGTGGGGVPQSAWGDAGGDGGRVITGGAWYPGCGPFPAEYHGRYFVSLYGGSAVRTLRSRVDPTVEVFDASAGIGGDRPLYVRVGPEGHLYYLVSDYETSSGAVIEVRPIGSTSTDLDADGSIDACASASILVGERGGVWRWNVDPESSTYQLLRGSVGLLRTAGLAASVDGCLAAGTTSTVFPETETPQPGEAYWYLARPSSGPRSTWSAPGGGAGSGRDTVLSDGGCP